MIRLKVLSTALSKTITVKAAYATIGSQNADLILPHSNLQPEHLRIVQENNQFIIHNVANDPFVTLNSIPFGKKVIVNYDLIQIGKTVIEFYGELPETNITFTETSIKPLEIIQGPKNMEQTPSPPPRDPKLTLFTPPETKEEPPQESQKIRKPTQIFDFEETPDPVEERRKEEAAAALKSIKSKRWRFFTIFGLVFLFCALFGGTIAYVKISNQNIEEQITAAEGVSDFAMALAYAQVNHIIPQKQNWFDPDFLKNNLASVLSAEYPSFANIDSQGQFMNCPYILRIYTSTDLKQFLVLAQPEPSILHWLFPKPAIAVDSKTMELRLITNIRGLNRLLANPNVLDSPQASEISYLVRQGELIPLSSFEFIMGFSPPKALSLVRPTAENLIYNAPRYYHFGEALLQKAVSLLQIVGSSHEVSRLQQQIVELAKFPNLVLYSSQGLHKAVQSQKALLTLVPNSQFLTAYLNLDTHGYITASHLLLNEDYPEILTNSFPHPETIAKNGKSILFDTHVHEIADVKPTVEKTPAHEVIDTKHPLYLQLSALATERQRALKAISDRLIVILNGHNEGKAVGFSDNFLQLVDLYVKTDQNFQNKATGELASLYREHSAIPLEQFSAYVKASGLGVLARESLHSWTQETDQVQVTPEQIERKLSKIEEANSFDELCKAVTEAADRLNLSRLPNPEQLIGYQNRLRLLTIKQLNRFIFSSRKELPQEAFNEANRAILSDILKITWVTDPDEYQYFLDEFDNNKA